MGQPSQNLEGCSTSAGANPLVHGSAVDPGNRNDQVIQILAALIFCVTDRAVQYRFNEPGSSIREESQLLQGIINILTANELRKRTHLLGGYVGKSVFGCVLHFGASFNFGVSRKVDRIRGPTRSLSLCLPSYFFLPPE